MAERIEDLSYADMDAPPDSSNDDNDQLLTLSFNQDGGCVAVGTANGFRICNVSPFQETFRRTFSSNNGGGGIGSIEMLFRCNLLALVGGGTNPQYPPNKVLIWDDHLGKPIGELIFRQRVLAVRLRRDRICVALSDQVYVYNFGNLSLLDTIATGGAKNGLGLLCISTDAGGISSAAGEDGGMVLVCPSVTRGQVRVELYGLRKTVLIDAHESSLAAMALTVDGSMLATASVKGTIIRLFETGKKRSDSMWNSGNSEQDSHPPGTPLRQFRRGVEYAAIVSLSFSLDKMWLASASDRGETVHIFKCARSDNRNADISRQKVPSAPKSTLSTASKFAKRILPSVLTTSPKKYLQGEQSFVKVRSAISRPQICAFVPDQPHTIAIAGLDDYGNGCLMIATFCVDLRNDCNGPQIDGNSKVDLKPVKGEATRQSFHRFFKKGIGRNVNNVKNLYTGDGQVICSDESTVPDNQKTDNISMKCGDSDDFISVTNAGAYFSDDEGREAIADTNENKKNSEEEPVDNQNTSQANDLPRNHEELSLVQGEEEPSH